MMMRRNTIALAGHAGRCSGRRAYGCPSLFSVLCGAQDVQRLVLRDSSGRELFSRPAPDGSEFAIRYRHSVALSPVEDWFSVSGGCIYLEKTVYQDFGAGLLSRARDSGCIRKRKSCHQRLSYGPAFL